MAFRIQSRRDTTINWEAINPILLEGEMGFDLTLQCLKIEGGTTPWNDLPYFIYQGATVPSL